MTGTWPASFNLANYVLAAGRATPDKIALALVSPSDSSFWTFRQLEQAVRGTATGLLEAGLEPGDRLLMQLENDIDFPVVYLAAITVGILPVPCSLALTETELDRVADCLRPAAAVASVPKPLPNVGKVISGLDLKEMRNLALAEFVMGDPNRAGYIVLTSGTSSAPRLVVHAHRAIWARRMMRSGWYGLGPSDRLLHAGALNWTYTLGTGLLDPWSVGATALSPAPGVSKAEIPDILHQHKASIFAGAPGHFRQILKSSNWPPLPQLRHGLSAGERLPDSVRNQWKACTGTEIHEAYGQSECSTFVSGSPDRPAPDGSIGFAQAGRRIQIMDSEGLPCPTDQEGEISIHKSDPGLMLGYLLNAKDVPYLPLVDEWYGTGDIGSMNQAGAVRYVGRMDDLLNAGGLRVSPSEVEDTIVSHPSVDEAAAIEIAVSQDTKIIGCVYTANAEVDSEELKRFAARSLAAYKVPRKFIFATSLPRSANGKLLRRRVREAYGNNHG